MLSKLEIQNYAIIEHLDIDLSKGMNIITGETGAGKSIVLGALGLVMGNRADTKVLFDDSKKCYVEATFDISGYDLKSFFDEHEINFDKDLIIRREIAPGGKSRAFVNDSPCTLDILQNLSSALIDIHQQFDTIDLRKPQYQIDILDALSDHKEELASYRQSFKQYKDYQKQLAELKQAQKTANQEQDFLQFQYNELAALNLVEGEIVNLEINLNTLESAEEIKNATTAIYTTISENENALSSQIQQLYNQLSPIKNIDSAYKEMYDRLVAIREEMIDISKEAERHSEQVEFDPEKISHLQQRLSSIYKLQKKHGVSTDKELIGIAETINAKLLDISGGESAISELEVKISKLEKSLQTSSDKISNSRKQAAPQIEMSIINLLASLSMEHAKVKFSITDNNDLTFNGKDAILLLFAPNKGGELLSVKETASGGEMSRLALCIKSITAGAMTMPTLVFDEIDSGVSGEVAHKMGLILSSLSQKHQMICITHSPQIAAKAHHHYWVHKQDTDTRTLTAMKKLSHEERVNEIAKMLSGNPPSKAAIANAKDLINKAE